LDNASLSDITKNSEHHLNIRHNRSDLTSNTI